MRRQAQGFERRRLFHAAGGAILGGIALFGGGTPAQAREEFAVNLTEAEWRKRLTPLQFASLREQYTEPAFSSPLNNEHRKGTYLCAGCALPLFSSATKFENHTGWPSFWKPLRNAIGTRPDHRLAAARVEVHCRRCGGHLGHVFNDGPQPTGLRYCMNGLSLKFAPAPENAQIV